MTMTTPQPPTGDGPDPWDTGRYDLPSYPGHPPAYPGGYGPADSRIPQRPTTVTAAFWLWMSIFALGVFANVLLFSSDYFDRLQSQIVSDGLGDGTDALALEITSGVMRYSIIIGALLTAFIYLFFGIKMATGRNWARIVLTVLGGLSVLSGLMQSSVTVGSGVVVEQPTSVQLLGWVSVLVAGAALVAMYMPASNHYFRTMKAIRSQR